MPTSLKQSESNSTPVIKKASALTAKTCVRVGSNHLNNNWNTKYGFVKMLGQLLDFRSASVNYAKQSQALSNTSEDFMIDEYGMLTNYNGSGGNVVIPDGVISIGNTAFYGDQSITGIVIPTGVTTIGKQASLVAGH